MRLITTKKPWRIRTATFRRWVVSMDEGHLNRVQMRAVRRQKYQGGTRPLGCSSHDWSLLAGEVAHDDDVNGCEFGE